MRIHFYATCPYPHLGLLAQPSGAVVGDHHAAGDPEEQLSSLKELITKIGQFVAPYNISKAPFNLIATMHLIIEEFQRHSSRFSGNARISQFLQ